MASRYKQRQEWELRLVSCIALSSLEETRSQQMSQHVVNTQVGYSHSYRQTFCKRDT